MSKRIYKGMLWCLVVMSLNASEKVAMIIGVSGQDGAYLSEFLIRGMLFMVLSEERL